MSDWYYAKDNEQKGPINEAALKEDLAANKIAPDTLVWKEGMENWTPANQVPAFTFRPPPTPAKTQPAATPAPAAKASPEVNNPSSTQPIDFSNVVGKPEALEVEAEDAEANKVYGILAYLPLLFWVPLVAAKDSPFGKYHANQGLSLFLVELVISVAVTILCFIPFLGLLFGLLHFLLYPVFLIFMILGIINAANGKCVPLPIVGGIKLLK